MKISVIYPIYNQSKFLKKSLESILAQTYEDFEVLAVNDGSTDNSLEILKSFNDPRVKIFTYEKNRFINYARNMALDNATGDYIVWIDSDDTVEPNYFQSIINLFNEYSDIDAIKFNSIKFTTLKSSPILKDKMDTAFTWSKIVKASLVKDLRYPDIRVQWPELGFNLILCERVKKVLYINNNFYHYDNRGITCNKSTEDFIRCYQENQKFLYENKKEYLSLYDTNKLKFSEIHLSSVSIHLSRNYGSILTNYSLYKFLEFNNLYPAINLQQSNIEDPSYIRLLKINTTNTTTPWLGIVGSDFSWRQRNTSIQSKLVLHNTNKFTRRIAIGPSWDPNEIRLSSFKENIQKFESIFLRESYKVNNFNELYGMNATSCLDPVFLNDATFYSDFIKDVKIDLPENFIFSYLVRADNKFLSILEKIADKLNQQILVLVGIRININNLRYNKDKIKLLNTRTPQEFVYYFSKAEYVITDSFHGECFSLIFNKNFSIIQYRNKWTDRFEEMSKLIDDSHTYIPLEDFDIDKWHKRDFDYIKINSILNNKISFDKKQILDAIYGVGN